jgi:hypothetical protein
MSKETTTAEISVETWRRCQLLKRRPGESMDELFSRALDALEEQQEQQEETQSAREEAEAAAAATGLDDDWQAALVAVWAYLREEGAASPSDIREAVYADQPCDSGEEWWWKKLSDEIGQLPGVERASQRRFEYTGD